MPRPVGDLLLGTAFIVVGLGAISIITAVEKTALESRGILDFKTLPVIYATLLVALSAVLIGNTLVSWWRSRRVQSGAEVGRPFDTRAAILIVGTLALISGYVLALSWVPFYVATAVFLVACLLFYGRRPLWRVVMVSLLGTAALHWVFIEIIQLPLR